MLRIKQLRESKGLNMREAARILNMPYTTYVNYEKGLREPTSEVLVQLATFYDTSVDFIVGRDFFPSTKNTDFQTYMSYEFDTEYVHSFKKEHAESSSEDKELLTKFHKLDSRSQLLILYMIDHELENVATYEELLKDSDYYQEIFEDAVEQAKKELLSQRNDWDD